MPFVVKKPSIFSQIAPLKEEKDTFQKGESIT
jgi:hypothetical protein